MQEKQSINIQVLYQFDEEMHQVNVHMDNIYQYFAKQTNKQIEKIIVNFNGEFIKRTQRFSEFFHLLQQGVFAVYDIEKLVTQLEEARAVIEKQKNLLTTISERYNIDIDFDNFSQQLKIPNRNNKIQKQVFDMSQITTGSSKESQQINDLIHFKMSEIKKIEDISIKSCINFGSQQNQQMCKVCSQPITTEYLETKCKHFYHQECFDIIVQAQIQKGYSYIQCACEEKISKNQLLIMIGDRWKGDLYFQQILQNQIQKLIQNYGKNLVSCSNKACYFFYFKQNGLPQKNYCPLCLV